MCETQNQKKRKYWLMLSVIVNLSILGFFKYYNFFSASLVDALSQVGIKANLTSLNIILPVGISFYTFHGLSYVIDIYYEKIEPEKNFINYGVFVSFFPLLVAGPIERATHLLPQITKKRNFDYSIAVDGLKQILWGVFKKVVIADNCAEFANQIFNNSFDYSGWTLLLGTLFFTFQVYADFSGYSDIAIGTAHLLGIDLIRNFNFPFFSKNVSEFWRRWHISLSSWFNDYIFIPIASNSGWRKLGLKGVCLAIFITFTLCGLWHGANWTFVIYGFLQSFAIVFELLFKKQRTFIFSKLPAWLCSRLSMFITFSYFCFSLIFFRSRNITQAVHFIIDLVKKIFSTSNFTESFSFLISKAGWLLPLFLILFIYIEWKGKEQKYPIQNFGIKYPQIFRYLFYYSMLLSIFLFAGHPEKFIYFQF